MIKKILIATSNQAKIKEIKAGLKSLKNLGIKIITLNDVGVEEKPEETGNTFCENSLLKARFYGELTNIPTIADDGGLIIPYLNNEPGVKSRRWLGYEATDEQLIKYTLERLKNTPKKKRIAYLQTCLCFYIPKKIFKKNPKILSLIRSGKKQKDEFFLFEQEKIKGYIAKKPSKKPTYGYPFRALFIVDKLNKYYDELTKKEHEKINHRLKALKKLTKKIINLLK